MLSRTNFLKMASRLYSSSTNGKEISNLMKEICNLQRRTAVPSDKLLAQCHEFCDRYKSLTDFEKVDTLQKLAVDYCVSKPNVLSSFQHCLDNQADDDIFWKSLDRSETALKPSYYTLLRSIGHLEGGVKFLSDLRTNVLEVLKTDKVGKDSVKLKRLDSTLRQLLSLWFSVGLLKLERVSWNSSCHLLEKIASYEAVHPFRNWSDAKRRVGSYRRCFTFLHPAMPGEPIVVLHVALTEEISSNIHSIVSTERDLPVRENTNKIKAAIFYSITSTQKGLQGVDLGNFLIKRVVVELLAEFPDLKQFSTLSPIPNFAPWLMSELNAAIKGAKDGLNLTIFDSLKPLYGVNDVRSALERFKIDLIQTKWCSDENLKNVFEPILMHLCAHYLYKVKHRGNVYDPVGNFHLRNGAVLWRLNYLADRSVKGVKQSFSIMANYRYFLDRTELNSQQYMSSGLVQADESILNLLKKYQQNASSSSKL